MKRINEEILRLQARELLGWSSFEGTQNEIQNYQPDRSIPSNCPTVRQAKKLFDHNEDKMADSHHFLIGISKTLYFKQISSDRTLYIERCKNGEWVAWREKLNLKKIISTYKVIIITPSLYLAIKRCLSFEKNFIKYKKGKRR